ncbi:MAG: flagellar motor switch protein FliG [bacterium]
MVKKLTPMEKASILLMVMGDEVAPEIIKKLSDRDLRKIGQVTVELGDVGPEEVETAIRDFLQEAQIAGRSIMDSENFLRSVVEKAHGNEKADVLLNDIYSSRHAMDFLNKVDAVTLKNILIKEQPQTIALILSYPSPEKASEVLPLLPEELRTDVLLKMAELSPVSPDILQDMEDVLQKEVKSRGALISGKIGGAEQLASIFNEMDKTSMTEMMSTIEEEDEELADKIKSLMFVFEDFLDMDNRSIQAVLQEVGNETLVLALKGASNELQEKIFQNVSSRAAEMLRDDLETMGPVKVSDVESAQSEIVRTAMRLEEEGKIVLSASSEEMI